MELLNLINERLVSLAILLVLLMIASILAWVSAFWYGRERARQLVEAYRELESKPTNAETHQKLGPLLSTVESADIDDRDPVRRLPVWDRVKQVLNAYAPSRQLRGRILVVASVLALIVGGYLLYPRLAPQLGPVLAQTKTLASQWLPSLTIQADTIPTESAPAEPLVTPSPTTDDVSLEPAGPPTPVADIEPIQSTPVSTTTTTPQTLIDLTLDLPSDWTATDTSRTTASFAAPNASLTVTVVKFPRRESDTLESWANRRYSTKVFGTSTPTTVSDLDAYAFSRENSILNEREQYLVFATNDAIYSIQLAAPTTLPADDATWQAGLAAQQSTRLTPTATE